MEVQSVQAIASLSLSTIASEFIRPEDEQPGITGAFLDVPVIDIGRGSESSDIVRQVSEASSEWGIFQIVNHGIPDDVIRKMQRVGKEFFELSQEEEKQLVAQIPDSDNVEGYGTKYLKSAKASRGWVDHLFLRIWPPSAVNYHFWPENPPSFREANEEYAMRLNKVADKMFEYLSLGLGLERNAMKEAVGGDEQLAYLMKINYYPPCPRPDLVLGVGAHTDMCAITLLVPNEVQGLQVFRNERWYDVEYIPNALIVHTGDQVEILSNGKYKSVFHRTVVNKDETRMSWPVFLEPVLEQEIGPIPELVNEDNPAKFKTKTYKDFVYCKLNKIPQ